VTRSLRSGWGVAPAAVMTAIGVYVPLLLLFRLSLCAPARGRGFYEPGSWTLQNYARLADPLVARTAAFTIVFGLTVAAVSVALGYASALFLYRLTERGQRIGLALLLLPKTAGLLATLFGIQYWLDRGLFAALIGEVYFVFPYSVLVLFAALRRIDPDWLGAARGLGASRWQIFRRIVLPLSRPALLVAFQLSALWGLGSFLGPLFLGEPRHSTLSVEFHRRAFEYGEWPLAAAEATLLLGLLLLAVVGLPSIARQPPRRTP